LVVESAKVDGVLIYRNFRTEMSALICSTKNCGRFWGTKQKVFSGKGINHSWMT
jgi:hypothetical protein